VGWKKEGRNILNAVAFAPGLWTGLFFLPESVNFLRTGYVKLSFSMLHTHYVKVLVVHRHLMAVCL